MESSPRHYKDFDEALAALEQTDEVQFDSPVLKTRVKKAELEQGLFLYSWYFTFKEAYTFTHRHQPGKEHYLLLICQFSPMLSHIQIRNNIKKEWHVAQPYYILLNSESEVAFNCRKGSRAKCVSVLMTGDWLEHQLQSARHETTTRSLNKPRPEPVLSFIQNNHVELAAQLYNDLKANHSLLALKAGVYQLLNLCMEVEGREGPSLDETDPLQHAEAYIVSCLHSRLPSLEELARISNMSISSFKRNFKKKFGTGIYEYYLNRKMELARDMIVHQHMNVGQVAFELGYESFSHFSHIFSKHFGEPPGHLKTKPGK